MRWTPSHSEKEKQDVPWTSADIGIHLVDTIASNNIGTPRRILPNITTFQGDILETIEAVIPDGTWLWITLEGTTVFESLRVLVARKTHVIYLNGRDTLRNKKNMQKPSRWNAHNMKFATYITGFTIQSSIRIRGHSCMIGRLML